MLRRQLGEMHFLDIREYVPGENIKKSSKKQLCIVFMFSSRFDHILDTTFLYSYSCPQGKQTFSFSYLPERFPYLSGSFFV